MNDWRTEYQGKFIRRQSDERLNGAKPCPFCQAPDHVLELSHFATYVRCTNCGAEGPLVKDRTSATDAYERGRIAVEKWNIRETTNAKS